MQKNKDDLLKEIGEKFSKSVEAHLCGNFELYIGPGESTELKMTGKNFEIKMDNAKEGGDFTTISRFGFISGYFERYRKRVLFNKKKRIDKKWAKNSNYYMTISKKRDTMPIIITQAIA